MTGVALKGELIADPVTSRSRQRTEERERRDPAYLKLIDDAIARAKGKLPAQRTGWKLR